MSFKFTWDIQKNKANIKKHGLDFETAVLVCQDPFHTSTFDSAVSGEV